MPKKLNIANVFFVVILVNFFVVCYPLFAFPAPQHLFPDTANHYKMAELIQQDIKYISYNQGYRKSFNFLSAYLGFIISVGYAMALITTVFFSLMIFYSYKLAFLFSKDKIVALFTALLISSISIFSFAGGIPSPIPQTIALSLGVIAVYYFLLGKHKLTVLIFGFYSLTHSSVFFFLGLIFFFSVIEFFKEKKTNKFFIFLNSFVLVLVLDILMRVFSFYQESPFDFIYRANFVDATISPLSILNVTFPYGVILVSILGLLYLRKRIFNEKKFILIFLWFVLPLVFSQSYWFNLNFFPSSRTLIFMLFPLCFFTASLFSLLKERLKILFVLALVLSFSFAGHFYLFEENPKNRPRTSLDEYDLDVISYLKQKPLDAIVSSEISDLDIITLSHKKISSRRNFWSIILNKKTDLLDFHNVDYLLINKNAVEGYKEIKGVLKEFENDKYVLYSLTNSNFKKKENLLVYLKTFLYYFNSQKLFYNIDFSSPLKLKSIDTNEEICVLVDLTAKIVDCSATKEYLEITAKKKTWLKLLDIYSPSYFYGFFASLIRDKSVRVSPGIFYVNGQEVDLRHYSFVAQWTNLTIYSKPNFVIAEFFWFLGLR